MAGVIYLYGEFGLILIRLRIAVDEYAAPFADPGPSLTAVTVALAAIGNCSPFNAAFSKVIQAIYRAPTVQPAAIKKSAASSGSHFGFRFNVFHTRYGHYEFIQ